MPLQILPIDQYTNNYNSTQTGIFNLQLYFLSIVDCYTLTAISSTGTGILSLVLFKGDRLNMVKYARLRSLSGTADRACEVCFRSKTKGGHFSPYSVYNLFITYFNTEFTFCKLSYCNLKCLICSTLSGLWLICLQKIAEKYCWIKTTSKYCGKTMSTYWHQKTINGERRCCLWGLCSGCPDLLAPLSSFIRIWQDTMLLTLGFNMSKSFESSCEKPLWSVTSWWPLLLSLERLRCLHRMSTVTSQTLRHLNYYIMLAPTSIICFGAF